MEQEDIKNNRVIMEYSDWRRPRLRNPWKSSFLVLSTTLISILILLTVLNSFFTRHRDPVGCGMVWMRPIYAKYETFDTKYTRLASKYGLYLYREGGINEDFQVKGIPVLYVTGNAGSYKQARSIAAEAASYWATHVSKDPEAQSRGLRDLDFFTADFNEDITAFHGQTMLDQAEYLNDAIAYILSLYHDPSNPRREPGQPDPGSVIIIGHSMGGIVARTMLTLPNYRANSINTIITLSSPHARAPVSFDEDIVLTYQKINDYWRRLYSVESQEGHPLSQVTLISIAGGSLDTVVPSDYASLASLVPESNGFTVFTSGVPKVWTGCDHLSILWCDQLRKAIVRVLFQITDVRKSSQTVGRGERMKAFKKQFLTGMEDGHVERVSRDHSMTQVTLPDESYKIVKPGERLVLRSLGDAMPGQTYLLPIPTDNEPSSKGFTLLSNQAPDATGAIRDFDVLLCSPAPKAPEGSTATASENTEVDHETSTKLMCRSAAPDIVYLPASTPSSTYPFVTTEPFAYLQYKSQDLTGYKYIAVVDRAQSPGRNWIIAEFNAEDRSQVHYQASIWNLLFHGVRQTLPTNRPTMVNIGVDAIYSSLLAYKLQIGVQSCLKDPLFSPFVRQYIEDPYESKYFVNVKKADISLHGLSPYMPPPLRPLAIANGLSLQIWNDPSCGVPMDISLDVDMIGSLGRFVMRYRTMYPAFPLVVVALVLRKQFGIHDATGVFITFFDALHICMKSSIPLSFLLATVVSIVFTGVGWAQKLVSSEAYTTRALIDFAKNDILLGSSDAIFWALVPLAAVFAIGACVLINYVILLLVNVLHLIGSMALSVLNKLRYGHDSPTPSKVFFTGPTRTRLTITLFLFILVALAVPFQFAYIVASLVQLITTVRALRASQEITSSTTNNFYNYSHSILVLMIWVLPVNLPVFVVWIHNLAVHWLTPFSSHHNILSIMPFVVLVESLGSGTMISQVPTSSRHVTNALFFVLAVYAALYGVSYAYQLHDIANIIAAWLVTVQLSNSDFSRKQLSRMLDRGTTSIPNQHIKKRP